MRMAPGLVPQEQLVFLDSVLVHRKIRDEPVIFVNHYPLDESLANWYKVIDLLKTANIQATLLGHGHTNRLYHFEGNSGYHGTIKFADKKSGSGLTWSPSNKIPCIMQNGSPPVKPFRFGAKCQSGQTPRGNHSSGNINVTVPPHLSQDPIIR